MARQKEMEEFAAKVKRQAVRQERARQAKQTKRQAGILYLLSSPPNRSQLGKLRLRNSNPSRQRRKRGLIKSLFKGKSEDATGELVDIDRAQNRYREIQFRSTPENLNERRTKDHNALQAMKSRLSSGEYDKRHKRWVEKYRQYGFSKQDPLDIDLDADAPTRKEAQEERKRQLAAADRKAELNRKRTWEYRKMEFEAMKSQGGFGRLNWKAKIP